mmetsp:Transcript_114591/g.262988  ORF Transcript_114591/g.262988 Transcript_114591/m.262988 type:complete len:212 (-) Transcript_114591:39-674(-)
MGLEGPLGRLGDCPPHLLVTPLPLKHLVGIRSHSIHVSVLRQTVRSGVVNAKRAHKPTKTFELRDGDLPVSIVVEGEHNVMGVAGFPIGSKQHIQQLRWQRLRDHTHQVMRIVDGPSLGLHEVVEGLLAVQPELRALEVFPGNGVERRHVFGSNLLHVAERVRGLPLGFDLLGLGLGVEIVVDLLGHDPLHENHKLIQLDAPIPIRIEIER